MKMQGNQSLLGNGEQTICFVGKPENSAQFVHSAWFVQFSPNKSKILEMIGGPSSKTDAPSKTDGPSSKIYGPSSKINGPSSGIDGPSSENDGPSSKTMVRAPKTGMADGLLGTVRTIKTIQND